MIILILWHSEDEKKTQKKNTDISKYFSYNYQNVPQSVALLFKDNLTGGLDKDYYQ